MIAVNTHCRIGRVKLKGSRSVAKRLPLKLIETSLRLQEEISRATDKQKAGRGSHA